MKYPSRLLAVCALLSAAGYSLAAQPGSLARTWGDWPLWGDQGDGTYQNPVLPADYSDLDCIRVGEDYYAISSTFQFSPGMVILQSRDLVNWRIAGHAVTDLTQISPELNWDRMNRYSRGIWAGAIRHHAGKFWIYFGTPDEGYFMTTAPSVEGPWEPLRPVLKESGWDDCCPFWDDDGQGYLVGTHFAGGYKTYLFKLTPDGRQVIRESGILINEGRRREASKLYKIDGWYYHLFSEHVPEVGRYLLMQRSRTIGGPYTEVRQLSHADRAAMEPNQGGLVQTTKSGEWFFLTHHGTGKWEGRAASLLPVTWIDGWPIIGTVGADGIGSMTWTAPKPTSATPLSAPTEPQGNDEFTTPALAPQWEWNYQPRADYWSLAEHPGYLRLRAFRGLAGDNILKVGNVLTQRSVRAADCAAIIRLDLSGLVDGQHAGLCHFSAARSKTQPAAHSASLGVVRVGDARFLEFSRDGVLSLGPTITTQVLWLKSTWGLDGVSQFSYSVDGEIFTPFGETYPLAWGSYRGDRLGIFTYNNRADAGHVDVDAFHLDYAGPHSRKK